MSDYVYCAVNKDGVIQQVCGSSKKTYYFRTDHYLEGVVSQHNYYHANDLWKVQKFELVAVEEDDSDYWEEPVADDFDSWEESGAADAYADHQR